MLLIVKISGLIALAALLAGCVLLYLRLRNTASTSFLLSIVGLLAWAFWIQDWFAHAVFDPASTDGAGQDTNAAEAIVAIGYLQTISDVCHSLLLLWVGISFFFAIKSIKSKGAA